jgi:hypothetical protein
LNVERLRSQASSSSRCLKPDRRQCIGT